MSGDERIPPTPGQTVGPFFHYGVEYAGMGDVVHPWSPGALLLQGLLTDGAGLPVPDGLVEIFGADADGRVPRARGAIRRDTHTFTGFGRAVTNDDGRFQFWVREPGSVDGRPPFFATIVFARGLPDKLHTRIYLPEAASYEPDALLASLDERERRTLISTRTPDGHLHHDIRLQGERETVFIGF